jgi:hypothetical protein
MTAKLIRQILLNKALVAETSASDWYCTIMSLPDGQGVRDNIVTLTDTEGNKDGRIMQTGEVIVHPGFQVRVRSTHYEDGRDKINKITDYLDAVVYQQIGNKLLVSLSRQGGVMPMGLEQNGRRYHFSVNYTATLQTLVQ